MDYILLIDANRDAATLTDELSPELAELPLLTVRDFRDAVNTMSERGCPVALRLGYRLADRTTTLDVVNWMILRDLRADYRFIPEDFRFHVHTEEAEGRRRILGKLMAYLQYRRWDQETGMLVHDLCPG
ncbi:cyclic-phosphate processing receiver domain-containing protein [Arhodomonas sp. SL1]|uniref:cyclic-phosphate processing receiver domain-containing protein n=1 Tax=Arhodomonas sp. SL1 TaxID=3425691 RepID=UPI003F8828C2